jgi:hypothetical protein
MLPSYLQWPCHIYLALDGDKGTKLRIRLIRNGIIFFAGGEATFRKSLEQLYLSWIIAKVAGDTYFLAIPEPWQPCRWEVFSKAPGVPLP